MTSSVAMINDRLYDLVFMDKAITVGRFNIHNFSYIAIYKEKCMDLIPKFVIGVNSANNVVKPSAWVADSQCRTRSTTICITKNNSIKHTRSITFNLYVNR